MVQLCMVVPLTYMTRDILFVWLKQVPNYSVIFTQLVLIHSLLRAVHYPINNMFKSVGNLKAYQIAEGIVLALPLLVSYFALRAGYPYYSLFVFMIAFEIINFVIIVLIARRVTGLSVRQYMYRTVIPCVLCFGICLVGYWLKDVFWDNIWLSLGMSVLVLLFSFVLMFFIGFSSTERKQIISILKK